MVCAVKILLEPETKLCACVSESVIAFIPLFLRHIMREAKPVHGHPNVKRLREVVGQKWNGKQYTAHGETYENSGHPGFDAESM